MRDALFEFASKSLRRRALSAYSDEDMSEGEPSAASVSADEPSAASMSEEEDAEGGHVPPSGGSNGSASPLFVAARFAAGELSVLVSTTGV